MKIAIIGSGGQLGTDCTNIFSGNHQVTGFDVPEIDISSKKSVEENLLPLKPEVIINCAAFTAVDGCETQQELAEKINAQGPANLADVAQSLGSRLVHISTDYVFSGDKKVPETYAENELADPRSQYGITKLAGEKEVTARCKNNLILRTAWLYSGYGNNFLKTMLKLALSDQERQFTIVNDQYGSLTWSHTLARQIEKLLETDLTGVIHTTSEGYSTWYEAACYFLDVMEVKHSFIPCTTEEYPTPTPRPKNSILENGILNTEKLSVFRDWKEDVDQFVREFRTRLIAETKEVLAKG